MIQTRAAAKGNQRRAFDCGIPSGHNGWSGYVEPESYVAEADPDQVSRLASAGPGDQLPVTVLPWHPSAERIAADGRHLDIGGRAQSPV